MFCEAVARLVVRDHADIATVERVVGRREGRVYVDFLQNRREQTIVPPYVVRPVEAASVSMPLAWDELEEEFQRQRLHVDERAAANRADRRPFPHRPDKPAGPRPRHRGPGEIPLGCRKTEKPFGWQPPTSPTTWPAGTSPSWIGPFPKDGALLPPGRIPRSPSFSSAVSSTSGRTSSICEPRVLPCAEPGEHTLAAMRAGAEAIVQAELRRGRWQGRADVLLRVSSPSDLGDWSYEVVDTKLAQETRAGTVLQLCLYSELVQEMQGVTPEWMHVVKPGRIFPGRASAIDEYGAYYRLVRGAWRKSSRRRRPHRPTRIPWRTATSAAGGKSATSAGTPTTICAWLRASVRFTSESWRARVSVTLTQYAEEPPAVQAETRARKHRGVRPGSRPGADPARGRGPGKPRYELLVPRSRGSDSSSFPRRTRGCFLRHRIRSVCRATRAWSTCLGLRPSSAGTSAERGALQYRALWALGPAEERGALEQLIDFIMDRWRNHPGMHVYHFSPYEPAAVKRLIGRHGTREAELDRLLRAERFVDLLAVTRHGVRASVESYSLKQLEQFFGFCRALELRAAGAALRRVAKALELTGRGRHLRGGPRRGGGLQPRRLPLNRGASRLAGRAASGA